jgi:hypothetical protein
MRLPHLFDRYALGRSRATKRARFIERTALRFRAAAPNARRFPESTGGGGKEKRDGALAPPRTTRAF